MSSIHHVIHLPCPPVTMSFIHNVINSPCHLVTLSSIHPAINSHLPCRSFTISSSQDHGPCHPFTMSSIHRLSRSPCHSGPISSYHPQVTRPEDLTRQSSSSCWRPPWRGAPAPWGRSSSPFFACASFPSCSHPPTLPYSTANNHLPYGWISYDLFVLKTSNLF